MPFAYSLDLRKKVVEAYKSGRGSIRTIAKIFSIGESTVKAYLALDRTQGNLERQQYPGQKSSVTQEHRAYITRRILEYPSIRLLDLCSELEEDFDVTITEGWMCKIVKSLGFKKKKKQYLPTEQLDEALKKTA